MARGKKNKQNIQSSRGNIFLPLFQVSFFFICAMCMCLRMNNISISLLHIDVFLPILNLFSNMLIFEFQMSRKNENLFVCMCVCFQKRFFRTFIPFECYTAFPFAASLGPSLHFCFGKRYFQLDKICRTNKKNAINPNAKWKEKSAQSF